LYNFVKVTTVKCEIHGFKTTVVRASHVDVVMRDLREALRHPVAREDRLSEYLAFLQSGIIKEGVCCDYDIDKLRERGHTILSPLKLDGKQRRLTRDEKKKLKERDKSHAECKRLVQRWDTFHSAPHLFWLTHDEPAEKATIPWSSQLILLNSLGGSTAYDLLGVVIEEPSHFVARVHHQAVERNSENFEGVLEYDDMHRKGRAIYISNARKDLIPGGERVRVAAYIRRSALVLPNTNLLEGDNVELADKKQVVLASGIIAWAVDPEVVGVLVTSVSPAAAAIKLPLPGARKADMTLLGQAVGCHIAWPVAQVCTSGCTDTVNAVCR
jgi:hypothetical protein